MKVDYNTTKKQLHLTFEIETRILEQKYPFLDDSRNGIISYKELQHHKKFLLGYIFEHITLFYKNKKLNLDDAKFSLHRYKSQTYITLEKIFNNVDIRFLKINYNLFFKDDPNYKFFINIPALKTQKILDKNNEVYKFSTLYMSEWQRLTTFIKEGVFHILDGTDHLLFVLMLIIPTIVLHSSLKSLVITITGFSVAHSITLFISGFGLYRPNTALIESLIAISIVIVALLNFMGHYKQVNYKIAFGFGLIHGFGFANVLSVAGVNSTLSFLVALFGFNLGVEFGQIFVILLVLPLLYILNVFAFSKYIFAAISFLTACMAFYWVIERVSLF